MARNFAEFLNIPYDYCLAAITELQASALEKLRAREVFTQSGFATIRVRAPAQVGGTRLITVNVKLSDIGQQLQEVVGKELQVSPSRWI